MKLYSKDMALNLYQPGTNSDPLIIIHNHQAETPTVASLSLYPHTMGPWLRSGCLFFIEIMNSLIIPIDAGRPTDPRLKSQNF